MKSIEFNIRYDAGDSSAMRLRYTFGDDNLAPEGIIELREVQRGWWQGSIEVDEAKDHILYGYALQLGNKFVCSEWDTLPHRLRFNCVNDNYIVYDMWLDSPMGY